MNSRDESAKESARGEEEKERERQKGNGEKKGSRRRENNVCQRRCENIEFVRGRVALLILDHESLLGETSQFRINAKLGAKPVVASREGLDLASVNPIGDYLVHRLSE